KNGLHFLLLRTILAPINRCWQPPRSPVLLDHTTGDSRSFPGRSELRLSSRFRHCATAYPLHLAGGFSAFVGSGLPWRMEWKFVAKPKRLRRTISARSSILSFAHSTTPPPRRRRARLLRARTSRLQPGRAIRKKLHLRALRRPGRSRISPAT